MSHEDHSFFSEVPSCINYKKSHKLWMTEMQKGLLSVKKDFKYVAPQTLAFRRCRSGTPTTVFLRE